jgi:hypothetical protein
MKSLQTFLVVVALASSFSTAQAQNRRLGVILDAPSWLQYRVEVGYAGSAPFYNQNLMGGSSVSFSWLQNRTFFVRVTTYANSWYGIQYRVDQSHGYVHNNPNEIALMYAQPGRDFLGNRVHNLIRR